MNEFMKNGSAYITGKIEEALQNETRTAIIRGCHIIDAPVRIPSNFTLILENCHLRLADGCYSNIFVNEHHDTEIGKTVDGTDSNISIIGRGTAILDGGEYNGLSERNHMQNGLPPIWKNNLVLFTNVSGFMIKGISCRNQRYWALNFVYCANGYLGNIDFCANDTAIDAEGNIYHGLKHSKYKEILVKNADGIDLRRGCHHITIENITGFTEDDSIALTALDWHLERQFKVEGLPSDLCDITVRNIATSAFCANVRLLNQGEIKLHDITIDGVYDTSADSPYMERGLTAIRIGDNTMYGTRHATEEETYNITVRNVRSRARCAVTLAGAIKNLVMYGIECEDGAKMLSDQRIKR
ncbi:MAG: hypothetical protein E7603_01835 [Ruminococcaceae bacterium]|nr:hypothetical protein [Oscillospiraceae bacterium]